MLNLKLGNKELKVKFAYEATVRSGIIKKMVAMDKSTDPDDNLDSIQEVLELIPEMLLVGVQKYHREEYKYDYETGDGKEENLSKMYELLDDYFDQEDSDFMQLLSSLRGEMLKDGFLSKLYHQEQKNTRVSKVPVKN